MNTALQEVILFQQLSSRVVSSFLCHDMLLKPVLNSRTESGIENPTLVMKSTARLLQLSDWEELEEK